MFINIFIYSYYNVETYADTWSEYQNGEPIGDKALILISDGQIEILKGE